MIPLGITTYLMALITVVSGLYRVKLNTHKLLAGVTIFLASLHAILVLSEFLL
jgi:hypothetical protein